MPIAKERLLHILRNPWGWSEEDVRSARLAAAELIEKQRPQFDLIPEKFFHDAITEHSYPDAVEHELINPFIMLARLTDGATVAVIAEETFLSGQYAFYVLNYGNKIR